MKVGIDGSNAITGGGLTHLSELLNHAFPEKYDMEVVVWSRNSTLSKIRDQPWLKKIHVPVLEKSLPYRHRWRNRKLSDLASSEKCDIIIIPGSIFSGKFRPYITICQNALPYSELEKKRFGLSTMRLKLELTKFLQVQTLNRSEGTVFCSDFTKNLIVHEGGIKIPTKVAYVGINKRFYHPVKQQQDINFYTQENPFTFLYVSTISAYKHQWILIEAIHRLREEGYPLALELIGKSNFKPSMIKLNRAINKYDPRREFVKYKGFVESFDAFIKKYHEADAFLFSSTCENLPNILVEAMAAGLPIASSDYGPMKEALMDGGLYYDPVSVDSVCSAIKKLISDKELRWTLAHKAQEYSRRYSWESVADLTFQFIAQTLQNEKSD